VDLKGLRVRYWGLAYQYRQLHDFEERRRIALRLNEHLTVGVGVLQRSKEGSVKRWRQIDGLTVTVISKLGVVRGWLSSTACTNGFTIKQVMKEKQD
jgi:hypothetical protein